MDANQARPFIIAPESGSGHVHKCVCVRACVRARVRACVRACVRAHTHTRARARTHTVHMYVYIYIYIYTDIFHMYCLFYLYFLKISLPLYVSRIIIRNKKVHDFTIS